MKHCHILILAAACMKRTRTPSPSCSGQIEPNSNASRVPGQGDLRTCRNVPGTIILRIGEVHRRPPSFRPSASAVQSREWTGTSLRAYFLPNPLNRGSSSKASGVQSGRCGLVGSNFSYGGSTRAISKRRPNSPLAAYHATSTSMRRSLSSVL